MIAESQTPLRRLKRAVEKVKLLVSSNLAQWLYNGGASSGRRRRQQSLEEPHGLLDVLSMTSSDEFYNANSSFCSSQASSPAAEVLERTMSSVWHEISMKRSTACEELRTTSSSSLGADDVNNRSENFIAIFRRHLEMERQISLELRYCKSNSFEAAAAATALLLV